MFVLERKSYLNAFKLVCKTFYFKEQTFFKVIYSLGAGQAMSGRNKKTNLFSISNKTT